MAANVSSIAVPCGFRRQNVQFKTKDKMKNKSENLTPNPPFCKTDVISSALPCPFCGGKDLQFISDVDGGRDVEFIVCMNNDCLCDGRIGKNKEDALSRWNSRHCL